MKKGISLLMLSTIVMVMLVISTSVVIAGVNALNSSTKVKFANELFYLQDIVNSYVKSHQGEFPMDESIVVDLSNVTAESITQFGDETKTNNTIILYKVDKTKLNKMDLRYGNEKNNNKNDVYAVSKETGRLYYVQGVKVSGKTYYTLTQDLEDLIQYDKISGAFNRDGIIFIPSTTLWTNEDISVSARVPKDYNVVEATVKNANNDVIASLSGTTEKDYTVYDGTNLGENCYIEIKYQKSTEDTGTLRQVYAARNVDKTPISINNLKVTNLANNEENIDNVSISFDLSNDISGVKALKYEPENISSEEIAKSYFKTSGILVQNNVIVVSATSGNVTIYVEDKAGNVSLETVAFESAAVIPGIPVTKDTPYTTINSDGGKDTAIIPKGFEVSEKEDEQTIETGLVVIAPDGSEFVWVPVPASELNLFAEQDGTSDEAGRPNMRGKLWEYTKGGVNTGTEIPYSSNGCREPDVVTDYDNDVNNLNTINGILNINLQNATDLKALMQKEYNDIYNSIREYHGFYIGRYETGDLSKDKVVSKKGNEDIGNQTWYTMYAKEKKYETQLSGTSVKSNMIYGSQWDATMRWFAKSKDNNVSTYPVNAHNGINANFSGERKPTGSVGSVNNIYDMAGNVYDWTAEVRSTNRRVIHGYGYDAVSSVWYAGGRQNFGGPTWFYNYLGTRMSLYIPASSSVTEKTYVKNGLILHLDGINNTGSGHSNTSTIWKDLSGNNNNGTVTGATWGNTGLTFDGIDDWVSIKELNYTEVSLEVVFKDNSIPDNSHHYMFCNMEQGGYGLGNNGSNGLVGQVCVNNEYQYLSIDNFDSTIKNTLTITSNGKESKLYLNGNLVKSIIVENGIISYPNNSTIMALGTNPEGSTNIQLESYKGNIFSARMYNRVLTEQEVKNNYEIDKSRFGM